MEHNNLQKVYTCPMHPEVRQEKPGMCSECGMNLVPAKKKETVGHAGHKTTSFLQKFWIVLALTVPILIYSELFEKVFGVTAPQFSGSEFFILALGSIVFFYGGWVFLASAWRELKARLPGMMTLIAMAIISAYSFSVFSVLTGREHTLFWELSTLIAVMLLGHWIEMRAVQGAQGALKELAKLLPDTVEIICHEKVKIISLSELREGNTVFVRPGGRIPADGVVVEGKSQVNEAMVTGESAPVTKTVNSEVIAGTINGDGSLKVRVTKVGEHTFLAGIMRLVAEAQASKSRLQLLSDKAAFYLTVLAVASGAITFVLWLLVNPPAGGGIVFATERLVAVLVIACPHALGLAIPLVASISTTMAARNGLLIRKRLALEAARKINVVLFDKTGTLTKGEYGVTEIMQSSLKNQNEILQLAASVDANSEHFVARAIVKEAQSRGLGLLAVEGFERIPGRGVRGVVNGKEIIVQGSNLSIETYTTIEVLLENELLGKILLADVIREESREAIQSLKAMGVKIAMVTGDSEGVAAWVAEELGIDEYFAKVLPQEKSEKVKLLQSKGEKVAMVGDGINDAPALTQADLGIAIGAGTNVAIESAGIILIRSDPRDIVKIIKLSKMTYSKMVQNLFWATAYNVIALPIAAGALAFKGIILQPAVAAIFMSLSTVIVAFNAVLLRRNSL